MSSKKLLYKVIENGRLLKRNGSWMYCNQCNKTVGYLCYSTYDHFEFKSECLCGVVHLFKLAYKEKYNNIANSDIKKIKNRFCCSEDDAPLFSVVTKNIKSYTCEVTCNKCGKLYRVESVI